MMICLGGVCVPLNLLIPFLIGLAHRNGWLKWIKEEWFTPSYWRRQYTRWSGSTAQANGAGNSSSSASASLRSGAGGRVSETQIQKEKQQANELSDKYQRQQAQKKEDSTDPRGRKEQ